MEKIFFNFFVFFIFFGFLVFLPLVNAIGITPAMFSTYFEPNLETSVDFYVFGLKPEGTRLELYVRYEDNNELNGSVRLSNYVALGNGAYKFTAYIKLPPTDENLTPGKHRILIGAREVAISEHGVMALTTVQVPIDIFVLYKGYYIKVELEANDIALNETAQFKIKIKNLGNTNVTIQPTVEIYDGIKNIASIPLSSERINTKEEKTLYASWDSKGYRAGIYKARAIVKYGEKIAQDEKEFRIGALFIEILDFTKEFNVDSIEPFYLQVQSKWNARIENVYANISIFSNSTKIADFKTIAFDVDRWERKTVKSYIDTKGIKPGKYLMTVVLHYANQTTTASSEVKFKKKINVIAITAAVIIVIILIILILVIRFLLKLRKKRKAETMAERKKKKVKKKS